MFRIDEYMDSLISVLKESFEKRLLYIGLQGSYLRHEEKQNSDIDIMAVVDGLSVTDLGIYREALISVGNYNKSCGFICGKTELENWNPLEICHLLNTTKDYYGQLKKLVPAYSLDDERNYVKLSLNSLFHEICHRYIHADRQYNISKLPEMYKSVFYILQNLYYLDSGNFVLTKHDLLECVQGEDKSVLEWSVSLQEKNYDYDFDAAFSVLFHWCQSRMNTV